MAISFERWVECDTCGKECKWSDTRKQGGYRVCLDCYDEPGVDVTYIPPPTAKWDDFSVRVCEDEYGVVVWLEEQGHAPVSNKEYGVLVRMEGIEKIATISGEYGTLVFMPEGKVVVKNGF